MMNGQRKRERGMENSSISKKSVEERERVSVCVNRCFG